MKIAILGSAGFVGGYLTTKLRQYGHHITPVTRDVVDLRNTYDVISFFKSQRFDVVINAAINGNSHLSAPMSVASDNMLIFANLHAARQYIGKVIQFCSGAAMDRSSSISNAPEEEVWISAPTDPYGMSKNIAARISLETDNFFIIRLFGVFHHSESPRRLLHRISSGGHVKLDDRYFDYLYLEDLYPIVEYFINTDDPVYKDLNAVYVDKQLLSSFVATFCNINNITADVEVSQSNIDYTGSGIKLAGLGLSQLGLSHGLQNYLSKGTK